MIGTRMLKTLVVLLLFFTGGSAVGMAQQTLVANDVINWVSKSAKNPTLVAWWGDLTFDDAAKKLVFVSGKQSFSAGYDTVRRIVFDEATHLRPTRLAWKQWEQEKNRVNGDYWMYVEHGAPGGPAAKHMLQIPVDPAPKVINKAKDVFAGRVVVTGVRVGELIDRNTLKDLQSKHDFLLADRKKHPLPELKPDKALIVVVDPIYSSYGGGLVGLTLKVHNPGEMFDYQVKLHANDRVVLVNKVGTYGFAYLDPGDYQIAAQAKYQASVLQTTVEAGKAYYFLADNFSDLPGSQIQLSQHSPELVMHKLGEAYFGLWTLKSK